MAKKRDSAPFTRIVREIPATVPFLAPEAIERRSGKALTLRLGANESVFGPSPLALEAMREAAAKVNWYGDPESYDLRTTLAERHGVGIENIVIGCGVDDLLELIVRTYLEPGQAAVTSLGGYPTFAYHVAGYGGKLERVPYRDDRNDLAGLAAAAHRSQARIVYLANPDNPSGSWVPAEEIGALVDALPEDCLLLLDEAYSDFAPADALPPVNVSDPHVIRARTFSKAHGMAGARIGYALATAETIAAFDKIRLHFGVNCVAQAGALAGLACAWLGLAMAAPAAFAVLPTRVKGETTWRSWQKSAAALSCSPWQHPRRNRKIPFTQHTWRSSAASRMSWSWSMTAARSFPAELSTSPMLRPKRWEWLEGALPRSNLTSSTS
jgi:histidinol-phosphate aminotransferase